MLSIKQGFDYDGVDEAELPYKHVRTLGHGHSGTVEEVEDQMTGKVYARKTIRITGSKRDKAERTRVFRNEVDIIRGLESHCHIIRVHATYITKRDFGILLEPVASQGDLEEFLAEYSRETEEVETPSIETVAMKALIMKGFGCLAGGLAFMHHNRIRHKDIKPRNILVHEGKLIYTDFGYSFDSNGFTRSTTEGAPDYLTRRYSAPEVLEYDKRNSRSDIYSLGCVFLDMLSALYPSLIVDGNSCFAHQMDKLHTQLLHLEVTKGLESVTEIVARMTVRENSDRSCSTHIALRLLEHHDLCCRECTESPVSNFSKLVKHENRIATQTAETSQGAETMEVVRCSPTSPLNAKEFQHYDSMRIDSQRRLIPRHIGRTIEGTYRGSDTPHYEIFDFSYYVRPTRFFTEGQVFAVIVSETADSASTPTTYSESRSLDDVIYSDKYVHLKTRSFVVVRLWQELCFACPILTYSGQATRKQGIRAGEHGIAYSWGSSPQLLQDEIGITKSSIGVVMTPNVPNLDPASRINYGICHPIQFNVKAKEIGYVPNTHLPTLIIHWREEDERNGPQPPLQSSFATLNAEFFPSTS